MPMHFTAMGCLDNLMQGKSVEITLDSWLAFSLCKYAMKTVQMQTGALRSQGKQRSIWKMVLH